MFLAFKISPNFIIALLAVSIFSAFIISLIIAKDGNKINYMIKSLNAGKFSGNKEILFLQENLQIKDSLNELKDKLRQRSKKSLKKTAKIKLRNNQLQGILSSISHEFKNPISIINMSSQAILNDDLDDAKRDKFIEKTTRNSMRIVDMIDKLNLKSIQSLSLEKTSLDLYALISNVRTELLEQYKEREICIEKKDVWIYADSTLIRQVLINIIENALKYSQGMVEIYFVENCVFVRDYGVGIEQKDIKLVTKKYFKTKNNIHMNSFGIGLYVAKQILKLHGFELIVSSEFGKGSVFGFKYNVCN